MYGQSLEKRPRSRVDARRPSLSFARNLRPPRTSLELITIFLAALYGSLMDCVNSRSKSSLALPTLRDVPWFSCLRLANVEPLRFLDSSAPVCRYLSKCLHERIIAWKTATRWSCSQGYIVHESSLFERFLTFPVGWLQTRRHREIPLADPRMTF